MLSRSSVHLGLRTETHLDDKDVTMLGFRALGVLVGLFLAFPAVADDALPPCMDTGRSLKVINQLVAKWKTSTRNEFMSRARVTGVLSKIYGTKGDHAHFQIELDNTNTTLEVVYNLEFGRLPRLAVGMEIEACGDYITSYRAARYPPSPDGALIHWIHRSNSRHEHGYLAVDGRLFGQGAGTRSRLAEPAL